MSRKLPKILIKYGKRYTLVEKYKTYDSNNGPYYNNMSKMDKRKKQLEKKGFKTAKKTIEYENRILVHITGLYARRNKKQIRKK